MLVSLTNDDQVDPRVLWAEPVGAFADVDAGVVQGGLLDLQGLFDGSKSGMID